MKRQQAHWDQLGQKQYAFSSEGEFDENDNSIWDDSQEEDEGQEGFMFLKEAGEALSKLNQHEARRAKTPQRMRGRRAWD